MPANKMTIAGMAPLQNQNPARGFKDVKWAICNEPDFI